MSHQYSFRNIVLWYYLFGAVHEITHITVAFVLGLSDDILFDGIPSFLLRTFVGRTCILPALNQLLDDNNDYLTWHAAAVRHSGWVVSLFIALWLYYHDARSTKSNNKQRNVDPRVIASCVTAFEALSTDLLQITVTLPLAHISPMAPRCTLYCGNFGIILLNHAWLTKKGGKTAMDILEKMVNVTMMRGAQSGGVVTFVNKKKDSPMVGIRTRIVNSKRTDLSKLIRHKVERDVFIRQRRNISKRGSTYVQALSGHTRFATSSVASLDGTHPHRWTPPSKRRILTNNQFTPTLVENYITHNGDFDFYQVNGKSYDLEIIQKWLVIVTNQPLPATVDSCAVAGLIDLLRTQGCFGLSARYAFCFTLSTSKMEDDPDLADIPSYDQFEKIGLEFEYVLVEMLKKNSISSISEDQRRSFAERVLTKLQAKHDDLVSPLCLDCSETGTGLYAFVLNTIDAFFDNDLVFATKTFLKNASGSFGMCVMSSLDAHRQMCMAARGQTLSIAFYPSKGLICYGSEQAAVKAGMNFELPGGRSDEYLDKSIIDYDHDALRLDLDDLGGEVCLIDWGALSGCTTPSVSKPNRHLPRHQLMNGCVEILLIQESKATSTNDQVLYHRMTRLTRQRFIRPLQDETDDLVLTDIQDIPKVCGAIQEDWRDVGKKFVSLNRLTAWNLGRVVRERMEAHVNGKVEKQDVDILLTGCEVSLWLAEQFAADLQKSFPKLDIKAISSNKLLGMYGQEISVPSVGFPCSSKTQKLDDTIVIIVSHSGGTFAPLACSSLLQSKSENIFVVTSEWDTQIGKQLRALNKGADHMVSLFSSRIFTTEVGLRPAEPCSVSVAATHQLLTNIFQHICVIILSDYRFKRVSGAVITEQDLQILERLNKNNIKALEQICGTDSEGDPLPADEAASNIHLRKAGDLWSAHILEVARAYAMTIIYILVTVISGYPVAYLISTMSGLKDSSNIIYLVKTVDALIYIFLPQINVFLLRLIQQRSLLHRMTGRTIVIGDIPWVSQSADAFLSKLFAVSYSIAGVNVLSGNPADHFVHRHTHRVVRGTLLVCGRPDGRLSALSTDETAVCLSVNQASSIQSLGSTCEAITIGHNPFKLPLSRDAVFLRRNRPLFLCERMLGRNDVIDEHRRSESLATDEKQGNNTNARKKNLWSRTCNSFRRSKLADAFPLDHSVNNRMLNMSSHRILNMSSHGRGLSVSQRRRSIQSLDDSHRPRLIKRRSSVALLGAYQNFEKRSTENELTEEDVTVESVVDHAIKERMWSDEARNMFKLLDKDGDGLLSLEEFTIGYQKYHPNLSTEQLLTLFHDVDDDGSGALDYHEFLQVFKLPEIKEALLTLPPSSRDERGVIQIAASRERYFGETIIKYNTGKSTEEKPFDFKLARSQHLSQELYESRVASMQRFVAMAVMFHQIAKRVESFFSTISFGFLGYRIDRTQSILRIATTASPVSGADVLHRMRTLQLIKKIDRSIDIISLAWLNYKEKKRQHSKET